jgi:hypothetical protein
MAKKTYTVISESPDGKNSRNMTVAAEDAAEARQAAEAYNEAIADQEQSAQYVVKRASADD